jgi:hypothetical protein
MSSFAEVEVEVKVEAPDLTLSSAWDTIPIEDDWVMSPPG